MKKVFTLLTLCLLSISLFAQDIQVSGVVVDEKGEPVVGATIQVPGTSLGTISDYDGNFELTVPESAKTLVVSYIGMQSQEVAVKKNVRIVLHTTSEVLQDVVVTGYGNVAKGTYVASVSSVSADDIDKKSPSEISKALAGEVAGVQVTNTSGQPGTNATITIRGYGSINASTTPLYVVDGVPYEGDISSIDPGDIASTSILKDVAATALYGSRGANGVILITTKKGNAGEEGKIEVDVKYGANMHLLPLYEAITSPEEYMLLTWQGIYTAQSTINGRSESQSIANANRSLFGSNSVPAMYNIWNLSGKANTWGEQLINPYNAQGKIVPSIRQGVTRKSGYENMESWEDEIFRIGQKAEATVRIHGGTDKTTYYTSFGYLKDEGYYQSSDFDRFSTRTNVQFEPKKWLKGSVNMSYAYSTMNYPNQEGDGAMNNGFLYINNIPPIYPVFQRDEDGNLIKDPYTGGYAYDYGMHEGTGRPYGSGINPAGALRLDKERTTTHQVTVNGNFEIKLYKDLKFILTIGSMYGNGKYANLTNKYYGDAAGVGRILNQSTNYLTLTATEMLEYNKTIGDHTIRALAAHETNYTYTDNMYGYKNYTAVPNGTELSNAIQMSAIEGSAGETTLESALAQVTYDYDSRYVITGNYRADGTSRFAKDKRWGHFGSVGAAWNFTNESFMENVEWLHDGKLRANWGILGNQETVNYAWTDTYSILNVNDRLAYLWQSKGNPDLTWERASQYDVGLELGFDKYVDIELDYFYKVTDNMIFARYVAPSLGYGGYYTNDAKMMNQGVEFDVKVHAVNTRNVKLDITLNGGHYTNKMLQMPIDYIDGNGVEHRMVMSGAMAEGHSPLEWYLPEYAGVNPKTGEAQYVAYYDANKGGFGYTNAENIESGDNYIGSVYEYTLKHPNAKIEKKIVSGDDSQFAGLNYVGKSAMPTLNGGVGLDLDVYGVTLAVTCLYRIGGYGYDNVYAQLMHSDQGGKNNWHTDIRRAWTPYNTDTDVPRLSNGNDMYANIASTRFLTSNSFFSLANIRLGYNFPKKWIEKIKLNSLSLYVSGDNLAIVSARKGYNPTASFDGSTDASQYTPLSTVMGGIKFQF